MGGLVGIFDHTHYIPTIRWKRGERLAIKALPAEIRSSMTPLIEIPPGRFKLRKTEKMLVIENRVTEFAKEIMECWGNDPFFIDFGFLSSPLNRTSDGRHIILRMVEESDLNNLRIIPVTGLYRDKHHYQALKALLQKGARDVCVRISCSDVDNGSIGEMLSTLLIGLGIPFSDTHLIIEKGYQGNNFDAPVAQINIMSALGPWKTLSLTCGSFPVDLTHLRKNEFHQVPRCDWNAWKSIIVEHGVELNRIPTFGDCTIRHPIFSEPPEFANTSASIRYTADDYWLVLRGEALRKKGGQGHNQYYGLAGVLVSLQEYSGPAFSAGDHYINEVAIGNDGPGSAETWLRVGFNHHISFVVREISKFV